MPLGKGQFSFPSQNSRKKKSQMFVWGVLAKILEETRRIQFPFQLLGRKQTAKTITALESDIHKDVLQIYNFSLSLIIPLFSQR